MKHLSFQIIEDSRFPDKPNIYEQKTALSKALIKLTVNFDIGRSRFIDWGNNQYQYRSNVCIDYEPKRGRKISIITAINAVIPAPCYKIT